MRRLSLLFILFLTACASAASPTPAATSGDDARIDATVLAAFNLISGPAGPHDWKQFKELFAPGAHIISASLADDGSVKTAVFTPDEYSAAEQKVLQTEALFEKPISRRIERFRDIAQVFTTYEARHAAEDAQPYMTGIISWQLVRNGERWTIQNILVEHADAAHPIPAKYMPIHSGRFDRSGRLPRGVLDRGPH